MYISKYVLIKTKKREDENYNCLLNDDNYQTIISHLVWLSPTQIITELNEVRSLMENAKSPIVRFVHHYISAVFAFVVPEKIKK